MHSMDTLLALNGTLQGHEVEMTNLFAGIGFLFLIICIPIVIYKATHGGFDNNDETWVTPLSGIVVGIISIVTGIIVNFKNIKWRWDSFVEDNRKKLIEITSKPNFENSDLPWDTLLYSLTGLAGIIVLMGTLIILWKKQKVKTRQDKEFSAGWEKIISIHDEVIKEWVSYGSDPLKVIENPFMFDMREKMVCEFVAALNKAKIVRPSSSKIVSSISPIDTLYEQSVLALQTSFTALEIESQKIKWNNFSAKEQKRIQTAKQLFSIVLDPSSSESERQLAYKSAIRQLKGLLTIPEVAMSKLESDKNTCPV